MPPLGPPKRSARQRVMAQWRGVDVEAMEKVRAFPGRQVGSLIPNVLTGLRLDRKRTEAEIIKVWNHTVDPDVAAHAQPSGVHKGTLFVTVDSSAWLSEIVRFRRKQILERMQLSFGKEIISKISFRVG